MATETRIYLITPKAVDGDKPVPKRLVRAPNPARVRSHIARGFNVGVASQDDLIAAVKAGVEVEVAEDAPDPDAE